MLFTFACLASDFNELSSLERSLVNDGLERLKLHAEHHPAHKTVRKIHVITWAPFSTKEGFLTVFNHLHINSKDASIRRNIFQQEGKLYDDALVRDSELALREDPLVRSVAVIVPTRHDDNLPHEIDLLVATKDIVSLRPNFSFAGSFAHLDKMSISIGEYNFLGMGQSIAVHYDLKIGTHVWSASFLDPNFLGSSWELFIKPSFIFDRDSRKWDGSLGNMHIEKPLRNEVDRYSYGIDISYGARSVMEFNGKKIRQLEVPTPKGNRFVDRKYRGRYGKGSIFGRSSFGRTYKKEIFSRYTLNVKRPILLPSTNIDENTKEYLRNNLLPRNEVESYITLGFSYFHNRYLTLYDYENFKLQETKRIGPSFMISNDFSTVPLLFSDDNFLRPDVKLSYTHPWRNDSFAQFSAHASTRFQDRFEDNMYKLSTSWVSPRIYHWGRVVFDARLSILHRNRDNEKFTLGAGSGVRGVESSYYFGERAFRANLEFRSAPLDIWILYIGAVAFYDVGAAASRFNKLNPTHALGVGLRFLTPQVSSVLFRIDFAFPIYGPGRNQHVLIPSFGTGQAF